MLRTLIKIALTVALAAFCFELLFDRPIDQAVDVLAEAKQQVDAYVPAMDTLKDGAEAAYESFMYVIEADAAR